MRIVRHKANVRDRTKTSTSVDSPSHKNSNVCKLKSSGNNSLLVPTPACRTSRSMSMVYTGDDQDHLSLPTFPRMRSLSLHDTHQSSPTTLDVKILTAKDEESIFEAYTHKLYAGVCVLAVTVIAFVVYAFVYKTGKGA